MDHAARLLREKDRHEAEQKRAIAEIENELAKARRAEKVSRGLQLHSLWAIPTAAVSQELLMAYSRTKETTCS